MIVMIAKLTRYSDEHLYSVSVSMKTELRMGHATIRYVTSRCNASFWCKDSDANSRCITFVVTRLSSRYCHWTARTCSIYNTRVLQSWRVSLWRFHVVSSLTFRQWYWDYYSVTSTNPQSVRRDKQSGNAHKGESKFSCTEHLADVWFYVDILEMLISVSMIES